MQMTRLHMFLCKPNVDHFCPISTKSRSISTKFLLKKWPKFSKKMILPILTFFTTNSSQFHRSPTNYPKKSNKFQQFCTKFVELPTIFDKIPQISNILDQSPPPPAEASRNGLHSWPVCIQFLPERSSFLHNHSSFVICGRTNRSAEGTGVPPGFPTEGEMAGRFRAAADLSPDCRRIVQMRGEGSWHDLFEEIGRKLIEIGPNWSKLVELGWHQWKIGQK